MPRNSSDITYSTSAYTTTTNISSSGSYYYNNNGIINWEDIIVSSGAIIAAGGGGGGGGGNIKYSWDELYENSIDIYNKSKLKSKPKFIQEEMEI